jgi:hypothetical protein
MGCAAPEPPPTRKVTTSGIRSRPSRSGGLRRRSAPTDEGSRRRSAGRAGDRVDETGSGARGDTLQRPEHAAELATTEPGRRAWAAARRRGVSMGVAVHCARVKRRRWRRLRALPPLAAVLGCWSAVSGRSPRMSVATCVPAAGARVSRTGLREYRRTSSTCSEPARAHACLSSPRFFVIAEIAEGRGVVHG